MVIDLIKSDCLSIMVSELASVSEFGSLSRKKCLSSLTLKVFNMFFSVLSFATLLLRQMMMAGPQYFGANFLFLPRRFAKKV